MNRRAKDKKPRTKPKVPEFNLTPQGVLIKTSNQPDAITFFDEKLVSYEKRLKTTDPKYDSDAYLSAHVTRNPTRSLPELLVALGR